jgi:hypothetical protein
MEHKPKRRPTMLAIKSMKEDNDAGGEVCYILEEGPFGKFP